MNRFMKKQFDRSRGTALLFAIGITMLLFIIGFAFVITTQGDRQTITRADNLSTLNVALDAVIEQINTVLVNDLIGVDGNLLNNDASDEPYDYPGPVDPWLASLEPELFDDGSGAIYAFWRHITDLWGDNFGVPNDPFNLSNPIAYSDFVPVNFDPASIGFDERTWADWVFNGDYSDSTAFPFTNVQFNRYYKGLEPTTIDSEAPVGKVYRATNFSSSMPLGSTLPYLDELDWGGKSDADGDGVTDSRWVRIPNLKGPKGQRIYASVRIIDNNSAINVNTAYRDPTYLTTTAGEWDGSQLSHINLEKFRASGDAAVPVAKFQEERYGGKSLTGIFETGTMPDDQDVMNDTQYESDVAHRVLNPAAITIGMTEFYYRPYTMEEELELRNRFFISSAVRNRLGYRIIHNDPASDVLWRVTFDPDQGDFGDSGSVGRGRPYIAGNSTVPWFEKLKPDIDDRTQISTSTAAEIGKYNRRFISTTYSFDRIIRPWFDPATLPEGLFLPAGQRRATINPPIVPPSPRVEGQTLFQLAGAIFGGLPDDATIATRFGANYTRANLAAHMAVNLVDYQDDDNGVVLIDAPQDLIVGTASYFGVEDIGAVKAHTLCISKVGFVRVDTGTAAPPPPMVPDGDYFAIEVFNPDNNNLKALADFEIRIIDVTAPASIRDTLGLSGNLNSSISPGNTEVFTFAIPRIEETLTNTDVDEALAPILGGGTSVFLGQGFAALTDTDRLIVVNRATGMPANYPVDCIDMSNVDLDIGGVADNTAVYSERLTRFPNTDILLPEAGSLTPWVSPGTSGLNLGDDIDTAINLLDVPGLVVLPTTPPTAYSGFDRVNLEATDMPLRTLGEIGNVLAVGYRYDTATFECHTLWHGLLDSLNAIKTGPNLFASDLDPLPVGLTPPPDIEMGTYGRIRFDDPDYWGLLNYLTYFDPSNDGVDNDGNPLTSDNPMDDDIDQDGDNSEDLPIAQGGGPGLVDLNENVAGNYEVAVAGRININTAPWFVIKQLPWMNLMPVLDNSGMPVDPYLKDNNDLARAIVGFRDKLDLSVPSDPTVLGPNYSGATGRQTETKLPAGSVSETPGFTSIAMLLQVTTDNTITTLDPMFLDPGYLVSSFDVRQYLEGQPEDSSSLVPPLPIAAYGVPDYESDTIDDDIEARNLIFHRVSNLATVRSDVFTAYILVRLGEAGPQKRVIAIFDRTNVFTASDKPKLVALHPVPDVN